MKIEKVAALTVAKILACKEAAGEEVFSACGSDMMSDVLAFVKEQGLLLTGLLNPQVVRTAEMMDMRAILFVRNKQPNEEILALAEQFGIVVMSTPLHMFEACGRVYEGGLKGVKPI